MNKYKQSLDNVLKDNIKAYCTTSDIHKDIALLLESTQKAQKYDEITQELGCPLEVFFKALKEGIYVKDEDDDILFYYEKVVLDVNGFLHYIECGEMMEGFPLDEYKKTWFLKEDRSE